MRHYILMGGEHGCLPDYCAACRSRKDAVDDAIGLYALSRRQARDLRQTSSVELRRDQGAAYCEIVECDCVIPWTHCETDTPDMWAEA